MNIAETLALGSAKVDLLERAKKIKQSLNLVHEKGLTNEHRVLIRVCHSWVDAVRQNQMPLGPLLGWAIQRGERLEVKRAQIKGRTVTYVLPTRKSAEGGSAEGGSGVSGVPDVPFPYEEVAENAFAGLTKLCKEFQAGSRQFAAQPSNCSRSPSARCKCNCSHSWMPGVA